MFCLPRGQRWLIPTFSKCLVTILLPSVSVCWSSASLPLDFGARKWSAHPYPPVSHGSLGNAQLIYAAVFSGFSCDLCS